MFSPFLHPDINYLFNICKYDYYESDIFWKINLLIILCVPANGKTFVNGINETLQKNLWTGDRIKILVEVVIKYKEQVWWIVGVRKFQMPRPCLEGVGMQVVVSMKRRIVCKFPFLIRHCFRVRHQSWYNCRKN